VLHYQVAINAELDHVNIVTVLGTCMSNRPYLVVLDLCRYGDLHGLLTACHGKKFEVSSWPLFLVS
jgi:hypothetical protein